MEQILVSIDANQSLQNICKAINMPRGVVSTTILKELGIPVDTRSPIPVISVQSVGDLQYQRLSDGSWAAKQWQALFECIVIGASSLREC